jgi:tRNA A-37 threonylcarbamoyl transferase component Bud32/HAMP domain-containing protein
MSPSTPASIGRYRIEGILGQGAMSVVYAGFDPEIQRKVAIKCLHGEVAADPASRQRFQIEARAAGNLIHPHIVTIFDTGETDDGRSYIAMERLPGETLSSRVAAQGFPSVPIIIDLIGQIAAALDYAHTQGVVHHDVKPDNIMLIDGWQYAKIADFGIAEHLAVWSKLPNITQISGTPAFMAPERLRGEHGDARSDLFSLGVVMFWLLGHRMPWRYTDDVERLVRMRKRLPVPPLKPADPSTPPLLIDIVRTLMAPAPAVRYQRTAEVLEDLQLARRSYERTHDVLPSSRIHSLGVRWAVVLGATVVVALLIGMVAIYSKQSAAVNGLAQDFGGSLARMIASDAAENIVIGDKAATRALVEDVARNQQIDYLAIADRDGGIIASTRAGDAGQALGPVANAPQQSLPNDIVTFRSRQAGGDRRQDMLMFDVPIRYQAKRVGRLRLGISDAPLRAAQATALWVLAAVLVGTVLAVLGAAYGLFRRLQVLLEVLASGLLHIARGDYQHRIRLVRRDEFDRLFAAFNLMGESLGNKPGETPVKTASRVDVPIQPTQIITPPAETSERG